MPAPSDAASATLIFVYGTLKRGGSNHHHLGRTAVFLGAARTGPGYRLFSLGAYPGMIPFPADRDGVTGELWSIDAATLVHLDNFEGVPEKLYLRAPIRLQPPFADRPVETYFYARSVEACPDLGSTW